MGLTLESKLKYQLITQFHNDNLQSYQMFISMVKNSVLVVGYKKFQPWCN